MTLEKGDLILTGNLPHGPSMHRMVGTPEGVSAVKQGDVLVGSLTDTVTNQLLSRIEFGVKNRQ